jgi:hypothetical protein
MAFNLTPPTLDITWISMCSVCALPCLLGSIFHWLCIYWYVANPKSI